MNLLATARFATTVAQLRQLPADGLAEVAFVGRSNSGKSSAINALCQRRRLAFSSRTPGRTQALNYFAVGPQNEEPVAYLVDTPGYGYAVAPTEVRSGWDSLAGRYLAERASLHAVVLVVDVRRLLTDRDRRLLDWIPGDRPVLVLASKCDKLSRQAVATSRRQILEELRTLRDPLITTVIACSVQTGLGVEEARSLINQWLQPAEELPAG